jgi:probable rRNA maturation factor
MRSVHRRYAGSSAVTDVLSFAERDSIATSRQDAAYLGEIVICYPQAVRQAKQYAHAIRTEMSLLFVHGILHLLGFDHDTARKAARMRELEAKILGSNVSRTSGGK